MTSKITSRRLLLQFVCTIICAFVTVLGVHAQTSTGTVKGTVTDQSGSAIAGAQLVLQSATSGQTREATSSDLGAFEIPFLLPDTYTLTVSQHGFSSFVIKDIRVSVGEVAYETAQLKVGTVEQQVEVTAKTQQVDATTSTLGAITTHDEITTLPILGRSFLTLATLSAGAVANYPGTWAGPFSGGRSDVAVSISGSQDFSTTNLIDGVPTKSPEYGSIGYQLPLEMIEEFNIQRGFYSAKYSGPGVVNVVSRSGKNDIHGVVWDTFGNDKLDATGYFGTIKPPLRQNHFGGAFGGPIIKNRLFYFGNVQIARDVIGNTLQGTEPTAAELGGNLSDISTPIVNPFTHVAYPGNIIPADQIDPFAQAYIALGRGLIPAPTIAGVPFGTVNRIVNSAAVQNDKYFDIRMDYNPSSKDSIFGRFGYGDSLRINPSLSSYTTAAPYNARNLVLGWTHIFSSSLINEAHAGLDRVNNRPTQPYGPGIGSEDFNTELGLHGSNSYKPFDAPPTVNILNTSYSIGAAAITVSNRFIYSDNVAYIHGKHSLEFGGSAIRTQITDPIFNFANGFFNYTGQFSGNPLADFLLGYPQTINALTKTAVPYRRSWEYGLYAEDKIQATKDLTIDIGLRWELPLPAYDLNNNLAAFVPSGPGFAPNTPYTFAQAGKDGVSRTIVKANYKDFSPRLGLAWRPFGSTKWAVRASAGIFYETLVFNEEVFNSLGYPVIFPYSVTSDPVTPTLSTAGQFGSANPQIGGYELTEDPNRSDPYHEQYTLSVQRELPSSMLLTVAYVGNHGVHLFKRTNYNVAQPGLTPLNDRLPFKDLGAILNDRSIGDSQYNALQVDLEKRYSKGLTFRLGYTYSNAMDDAQTAQNGNYLPWDPKLDWQRSDFNLKHNFVLTTTYALPFGHGRSIGGSATGAGDKIISGWHVVGIFSDHTGFAITGPISTDLSNTNAGFWGGGHPNQICSGNLPSSQRTVQHWFDASCFPIADANTFGNVHPGILTGPGYVNLDFSAIKDTKITEKVNFQFRAEFFNALNKTNLNAPVNNVSSSLVGQILSALPARRIQFVGRIVF